MKNLRMITLGKVTQANQVLNLVRCSEENATKIFSGDYGFYPKDDQCPIWILAVIHPVAN